MTAGKRRTTRASPTCTPTALTSRGEMLNATDELGEVLEDEELLTLTKSVTAGGAH